MNGSVSTLPADCASAPTWDVLRNVPMRCVGLVRFHTDTLPDRIRVVNPIPQKSSEGPDFVSDLGSSAVFRTWPKDDNQPS